MKKALPVLWRYLAVVAVSCLLTFVISQSKVDASTVAAELPSQLSQPTTITTALSPAPTPTPTTKKTVASGYEAPGQFEIVTTDATWRDPVRNRDIPVRILTPRSSERTAITSKSSDFSGSYPVILFSHGLGGSREGGETWGKHWASHGFIILHMQHAGSDEAVWRDTKPLERMGKLKAAANLENTKLRIGDVAFVIDEIIRLNKAKAPLWVNADVSKIGMSGHSFGAQTTLAVSGQRAPIPGIASALNPNIKAAIAFSPNARTKFSLERQFGDISMPFFSITGTEDGSVLLNDGTTPATRKIPYQNMPAGEKYLAVFEDGDHMVFGGHKLSGRRPETARDREIQADVKAATLAFWDSTLKQDVNATKWLKNRNEGGFSASLAAGDQFEYK